MKIRKVSYNIDFVHIITFKDYYKEIIAPYFSFDNLQYGIDNENTIHESIRLIYNNEGFTLQFRKDGATLVYEGDIAVLKRNNAITQIFLDIVDKIKKMPGFSRVVRHKITMDCVELYSDSEVKDILNQNKYLYNPFGELKEFATVYEFEKEGKKFRLQYGNYTRADVVKFDLSPFKTDYNSDLISSKVGMMVHTTVIEDISGTSMSKLKSIIEDSENLIQKYLY